MGVVAHERYCQSSRGNEVVTQSCLLSLNYGYFLLGYLMAGSIKWFVYTTDAGTDYAIRLDESNTEAINGGTQDFVPGLAIVDALPRNIKPRAVFYTNPERTRRIRCVALTSTIYNALVGGSVPTIGDPIAGGAATLGLIETRGEVKVLPVPFDTGLNDGDAT